MVAVSPMVQLIRDSFAAVEPQMDEAARFFYGMLFSLAPDALDAVPANMAPQRNRLLRALVHVLQLVDHPEELGPCLRQISRDHRRFGMITMHFDAVGVALIAALCRYAGAVWTPAVEKAWIDAFKLVAKAMKEVVAADRTPIWWSATVVEHQRLSWDLAVVRVRPEAPVPYRAGQYVCVEVPQRPRLWRYLSPANAPRPDGLLEFHVRAVKGGWVSGALVGHCQSGDVWRIGPPMGRLEVDRRCGRDVLMIAGGTGIAPMRAMLEELSRWGGNPRVQVFYGGRTPADLYELSVLQAMAATNPWLTIIPVVEAEPVPAGAEQGTLAEVVTKRGAWSGHDVLVCGSPAMIRATVARMLVAGTPLDRIKYDPFTLD